MLAFTVVTPYQTLTSRVSDAGDGVHRFVSVAG